MFLHLGEGKMIPIRDIVMIGDITSTTDSQNTKDFFSVSEEEGFVIDYSDNNPKSFVLTEETIYISMISSSTLAKRIREFPGKSEGK
ncbi:DUF370 domain-containing protein [Iocasia frigidifontis]|uniref:DUF370 domain-containing protein n=1 Tax=Iocasia fonsfrigidae TaxID=2682810 RepID=A0A8A7K421_9FIRM|nr:MULTISPECIES: extracellular matrix/biofilm biosynthesis regulator RemA family protein [Halanaerobiaceae]AZO93604.1 DUF370 domain-containing protein [Halocella sp. SP3-1]QTL96473.1 DUF370 domain-containing protein [Iocasia fonsfrigidae]